MFNQVLLIILTLIVFYFIYEKLHQKKETFDVIGDNYDKEISDFGNISIPNDIDMTKQQDILLASSNNHDILDNTAVVDEIISKGTTLIQPDGYGFSPTEGNPYDISKKISEFHKYDYPLTGSQNADEMLARKQQQRSNLNRQSLDGSVRATRELYSKYFQEELNENEKRVWWSSESQPIETDFNPY